MEIMHSGFRCHVIVCYFRMEIKRSGHGPCLMDQLLWCYFHTQSLPLKLWKQVLNWLVTKSNCINDVALQNVPKKLKVIKDKNILFNRLK